MGGLYWDVLGCYTGLYWAILALWINYYKVVSQYWELKNNYDV